MRLKLNTGIRLNVSAMGKSASDLNGSYKEVAAGNISGLSTVDKYIDEDKKIKNLIELYARLVNKDANDISSMLGYFGEVDASLGKVISNAGGGGSFGGGGGVRRF